MQSLLRDAHPVTSAAQSCTRRDLAAQRTAPCLRPAGEGPDCARLVLVEASSGSQCPTPSQPARRGRATARPQAVYSPAAERVAGTSHSGRQSAPTNPWVSIHPGQHMLVCVKLSTSGVAEVYLEPPPVTPEPHCLDTLLPYFDSPEVEPCITVHNKRFPASHALQQGPWQLYHVEVCGDWAPHESHCSFPNCLYLHPPQQTATLASSQQVGQGPVLSHGPQWAVSAAAGAGAAVNNIQPLPQPLQMLQPMQRHGNASVGQAGPQAHWQPQPAALHSMALQVKQQQEGRQQGGQLHGLPGVRTRCNSRGLCDLVVWLAEPTVQGVRHHLANMIGKLQYEGKPWSPENLYLVLRSTYGADELVQLGVTRAEVVRLSTEPGLLELLRQTQQTRHPMLEAWLHYQTEADAELTADIVQRPRSR
ncbi:hypothetical protein V8C86DRAFT_2779825 [Haematococcus lacustris]